MRTHIFAAAATSSSPQTDTPPPEAVFKGCGFYTGPVAAIHTPGRGMGLGTTRTLSSPGELLLISRPIAAVAAVATEAPESVGTSSSQPSPSSASQPTAAQPFSQSPAAPQQPSSSNASAAVKEAASDDDEDEEGEEEAEPAEEDVRPRVFVPCYPEDTAVGQVASTSGAIEGGVALGEFESGTDALAAHMLSKRYTAQEAQWLEALAAGLPGSSLPGSSHQSDAEQPERSSRAEAAEPDQSLQPSSSTPRPIPPFRSSQIAGDSIQDQPLPSTLQANQSNGRSQLLDTLIEQYAFQLHAEDLGVAQIQGREAAEQVTGVWPEQGLLNHSCVPSTVSYTSRGALITRLARRSIRSGAELFTNYLGDEVMAPLEVRQRALQGSFGFTCACTRCKEEEKVENNLMQLVLDVYESCHDQVREDLEDAIADGDFEALQRIKMQLAAYVEVIDAAFTKSGINERTQILLQAGLMQLYESLFIVAAALGERDLRLCEMLQALAAAIQPGSELHLFWARAHLQATKDDVAETAAAQEEMLAAAQKAAQNPQGRQDKKGGRGKGRGGRGSSASGPGVGFGGTGGDDRDAVMHADQLCFRAYQARYGAISRRLYLTLLAKAGV